MDAEAAFEISLNFSGWERLGYVNSPKFRPTNLTREISPVFRYMDELDKKRWTGLTTKGYRTIEPVCRLASAMIESHASLAFLHALMYSPRTEITSLSPRAGYPCYEFRSPETSLIPDSEDPRLALERLAPNINWIVVDSEEISGDNGRTTVDWVASKIVDNGRNGFQCTIKIKKKLVIDLHRLSLKAGKTIQTLSHQFHFAAVLCHEVAHAFNAAVDPALVCAFRSEMTRMAINHSPPERVKYCEPFLEDQAETNLGYCWENEVFGESITRIPGVDEPVVVCKWPNHIPFGTRDRSHPPRRRGSKGTVTFYIIPAHFILSVQQQAFWDRLDPVDAIGLRVQKVTGARRLLPPGRWKDEDWEASASSEGDWPANERYLVYRNEEPDVVARTYSAANHAATTKWILDLPEPAP